MSSGDFVASCVDDDSPFLFRARPGAPPALLAGAAPGRAAATGRAALPALLSAVCAGLSAGATHKRRAEVAAAASRVAAPLQRRALRPFASLAARQRAALLGKVVARLAAAAHVGATRARSPRRARASRTATRPWRRWPTRRAARARAARCFSTRAAATPAPSRACCAWPTRTCATPRATRRCTTRRRAATPRPCARCCAAALTPTPRPRAAFRRAWSRPRSPRGRAGAPTRRSSRCSRPARASTRSSRRRGR